jgi:DNA mismatch repair protein MutL
MEEALAYPDVGFTVKNNEREQTNLPGKSDLLQRIAGLFGRDLVRDLIEVHEHAGGLELRGFIGFPTCHRANRNHQKVFVNNRPVKDKTISHAILQTYDTLVPKRRHPVVFLFLSLPPELVDVNVHPTKMEIRFVNSQTIHHFVTTSLRNTLNSSINKYTINSPSSRPPEVPQGPPGQPVPPFHEQPELPKIFHAEGHTSPPASSRKTQNFLPDEQDFQHQSPGTTPKKSIFSRTPEISSFPAQHVTTQQFLSRPGRFASMKPIGQFYDTYILVQDGEDLCIIDQHAAHERIYYERLKQQFQQTDLEIQQLLFPVSIELSPREQAALEEYLTQLNEYGLELEHFHPLQRKGYPIILRL